MIEMGKRVYVSCMDNGKFTLGVKHDSGAEPDITEQFTGVVLSNNKYVFVFCSFMPAFISNNYIYLNETTKCN